MDNVNGPAAAAGEKLMDAHTRLQAERGKGGWDSARRRENALQDGLVALAALHGRDLPVCSYQSTGEFSLALILPSTYPDPAPTFGVGFAADLGRVQTRQGPVSNVHAPLPEANWLRVNHFAAEQLVAAVAEDLSTGRRAAIEALYGALERAGGYMRDGFRADETGALTGSVVPSDKVHWKAPTSLVQVTTAGQLLIGGEGVDHCDAAAMDGALVAASEKATRVDYSDPWISGEDEGLRQRNVAPSPSM